MEGTRIEGFFISFEHEEQRDIMEALKDEGYTPDGQGIKELLIDVLFGDKGTTVEGDTERVLRKIGILVRENPEKIKMGIITVARIASMLRNKKSPSKT